MTEANDLHNLVLGQNSL